MKVSFTKMQGAANDYIYVDCFKETIDDPSSLAVAMSPRHFSVGADGLVLIMPSSVADARMRMFNADGSEGLMAGNALRCMAKYLYDNEYSKGDLVKIETAGGVKNVRVYTVNGKVTSASVDMGRASVDVSGLRLAIPESVVVDHPARIGGQDYRITCVDVGNPHCVVFCERVDSVDVSHVGPQFEYAPLFPDRINTEFIRVVNPRTIQMRVWERGSGETMACGTGACASVAAAIANGLCEKGTDVTVRARGGDLIVNCTDERVTLTGDASLVYTGEIEY